MESSQSLRLTAGKTVIFRLDARPSIGGGHLVRSFALAVELEKLGWRPLFAVNKGAMETVPFLDGRWVIKPLANEKLLDPTAIKSAIPSGCGLVIVDHYALGQNYHAALRGWARRIASIDDLADRAMECDVIIDPSPGRTEQDYKNHVPAHCRVLAGPSYALLRAEFAAQRTAALSRRRSVDRPSRVLVSFGMTDPGNLSLAAIQALERLDLTTSIDLILGSAAPHIETLCRTLNETSLDISLHQDAANVVDLMASADIAIGGAGGSALERCCMGLPTVAVSAAGNQDHYLDGLAKAGAVIPVKASRAEIPNMIADAISALWGNGSRQRKLSDKAASICDGEGAQRSARILDSICEPNG